MRLSVVCPAPHPDDFPPVETTNKGAFSLKTKPRLVATALVATLTLTSASPAGSNAIVVGDLVLIGTVVTAGVLYYVWQNQKTHKKVYTITDPEHDPVGELSEEPLMANSREEAERKCRQLARQYGLDYAGRKDPTRLRQGHPQWYRCKFRRPMH